MVRVSFRLQLTCAGRTSYDIHIKQLNQAVSERTIQGIAAEASTQGGSAHLQSNSPWRCSHRDRPAATTSRLNVVGSTSAKTPGMPNASAGPNFPAPSFQHTCQSRVSRHPLGPKGRKYTLPNKVLVCPSSRRDRASLIRPTTQALRSLHFWMFSELSVSQSYCAPTSATVLHHTF